MQNAGPSCFGLPYFRRGFLPPANSGSRAVAAATYHLNCYLIYSYDADAGAKRLRAAEIPRKLWLQGNGCLSAQVLQEFYVNATKKLRPPISNASAREILRDYGDWIHTVTTPGTIWRASEMSEVYKISFWDGLILAAAEQEEASIILTEDLNNGQIIAGIRIVNPFVVTDWAL